MKTIREAVQKIRLWYLAIPFGWLVISSAVITLAGFVAVFSSPPLVHYNTLRDANGRTYPWRERGGQPPVGIKGGISEFSFSLKHNFLSATRIRFIPDDYLLELKINGKEYPLYRIPDNLRMDYVNGLVLDLSRYLVQGNNDFHVKVSNVSGPTGFQVRPARTDSARVLSHSLLGIGLLGLVLALGRWRNWPFVLTLVLLIGIFLRIWTLNATRIDVRAHDLDGHIEYINYLIKHGSLPASGTGWQFYQPGLYYIAAALWTIPARLIYPGYAEAMYQSLQTFSLLLSLIFLALSLEILRCLWSQLKKPALFRWSRFGTGALRPGLGVLPLTGFYKWGLALSGLVLAAWPGVVIHSVRVGNDLLLYPLMAGSLLFGLRWWREHSWRKLVLALVFAVFALWTKTNAIVLFGLYGILLTVRLVQNGWRTLSKEVCVFIIAAVLAGGLAFGSAILKNLAGRSTNLFIGNAAGLNKALSVGNRAQNYLFFDLRDFLTQPFASAFRDEGGRQYFWNYFFKTSLTGEFGYSRPVSSDLALILGWLLLGVILVSAWVVWQEIASHPDMVFFGLLASLTLTAAMLGRISVPFSCGADFRYSLPLVIPISVFLSRAFILLRQRNNTKALAVTMALGLAFALFGAWFVFAL